MRIVPTPKAEALTPAAFATQFQSASRVLWCVAAAALGDRNQAEDVLQESALIALDKLNTFEPGTSFVAWMSQTVRYTALNHRRKRERRQRASAAEVDLPLPDPSSYTPDQETDFDKHVQQALLCLNEVARTCLLLKTVVELEYSEIADILDIPPGTAMSHVSRARSKMRGLLETHELNPATGGQR